MCVIIESTDYQQQKAQRLVLWMSVKNQTPVCYSHVYSKATTHYHYHCIRQCRVTVGQNSCHSRQTSTLASDSVSCLIRIQHVKVLSDTTHCSMVRSKSVCRKTVPDSGLEPLKITHGNEKPLAWQNSVEISPTLGDQLGGYTLLDAGFFTEVMRISCGENSSSSNSVQKYTCQHIHECACARHTHTHAHTHY